MSEPFHHAPGLTRSGKRNVPAVWRRGASCDRSVCISENKCSAVAEMGDCFATIEKAKNCGEGALLVGAGAGSPYNAMWPGPRPIFVPSGVLIHPAVWPQQIWAELFGGRGGAVPLGVELGPHLTQCCPGRGLPSYQVAHLDPSSRLDKTNMGRKLGVAVSL